MGLDAVERSAGRLAGRQLVPHGVGGRPPADPRRGATALVDRAVELITWSGVRGGRGPAARSAPPPERAAKWVLGYDGERWSNES